MQAQIRGFGSGATVHHMRVPDSKALLVPMPTIVEQRRIVDHIESLRTQAQRLEDTYNTKVSELNDLKVSLLHAAFNGEL